MAGAPKECLLVGFMYLKIFIYLWGSWWLWIDIRLPILDCLGASHSKHVSSTNESSKVLYFLWAGPIETESRHGVWKGRQNRWLRQFGSCQSHRIRIVHSKSRNLIRSVASVSRTQNSIYKTDSICTKVCGSGCVFPLQPNHIYTQQY